MTNQNSLHDVDALRELVGQYVFIKSTRTTFTILFENNPDILSKTANQFFLELNNILIHFLILSYCKITDPCNKLGKNLTIDYFMSLDNIKDDPELIIVYSRVKEFRKYITKSRNKVIAHSDFDMAFIKNEYELFPEGKDMQFLNDIEYILNSISEKLTGDIIGDICIGVPGDAYA